MTTANRKLADRRQFLRAALGAAAASAVGGGLAARCERTERSIAD